ncbi:esterase FE4, partial [Caerostris extrusa]
MKGAEDCLFINVFTPSLPTSGSFSQVTYPVMIFIHGGNFEEGSASIYGPEAYGQRNHFGHLQLQDRGFWLLSSGDKTCPGSMGLKGPGLRHQVGEENMRPFRRGTPTPSLCSDRSGRRASSMHILSPQKVK